MTSYATLIGNAILSDDPAVRQAAEDAVTVKMMAGRVIFCPYTHHVLGQATAVVIEPAPGDGSITIMHGDAWDGIVNEPAVQGLITRGARVLDGRVLFAKPKRTRAPRKAN